MPSGPGAAGRLCVSVGAPQRPQEPPLLPLRLPGNRGDPTRRVYAPYSLPSAPGAAEISNFCYESALMFMGASEWPCASLQAAQCLQYPSLLPPRLPGNRGDCARRVYAPHSLSGATGAVETSSFCYETAKQRSKRQKTSGAAISSENLVIR